MFVDPAPFPAGSDTEYLCGDLDGDGYADLVTIAASGWGLFRSTGDRADPYPVRSSASPGVSDEFEGVAADLNADGWIDFVTPAAVRLGEWLLPTPRATNDLLSEPQLAGAALLPLGVDRFGQARAARWIAQRTFERRARPAATQAACPATGSDWRPLTDAWKVEGAKRRLRVPGLSSSGGDRLALVDRWPAGLDVGADDLERQLGLLVELPLLSSTAPLAGDPSSVRVQIHVEGWRTADAYPADPASGDPDAGSLLPRLPRGAGGYQDVVVPAGEVLEICPAPDDDLRAGTGPRWVLEGDRIVVWTDRMGVYQAYVRVP